MLGQGPDHFRVHIRREYSSDPKNENSLPRHRLQAVSFRAALAIDFEAPSCRSEPPDFFLRSILGLLDVYNLLPVHIVEGCSSVPCFQGALQNLLREAVDSGCQQWQNLFTPRWKLALHPLKIWRTSHT